MTSQNFWTFEGGIFEPCTLHGFKADVVVNKAARLVRILQPLLLYFIQTAEKFTILEFA